MSSNHPIGSGLDVKDRIWLKLKIPDAFTGTNLVNWLYRNVHGFSDRKEARKYAAGLLKVNIVRFLITISKKLFRFKIRIVTLFLQSVVL